MSYGLALVLHLYLFEHGVLQYLWRNALLLHLDYLMVSKKFQEILSCFT